MATMLFDPVAIAKQFLYVREAGANRGLRVEAIQKWSGGAAGESWCMFFATMVLDICFQGSAPIPRQGGCENVHQAAIKSGWIGFAPSPGDLVLSINAAGLAHHVGIVSDIDPLKSVAGNTSEDGTSSNGDRVAEHVINPAGKVFVHYPRAT